METETETETITHSEDGAQRDGFAAVRNVCLCDQIPYLPGVRTLVYAECPLLRLDHSQLPGRAQVLHLRKLMNESMNSVWGLILYCKVKVGQLNFYR